MRIIYPQKNNRPTIRRPKILRNLYVNARIKDILIHKATKTYVNFYRYYSSIFLSFNIRFLMQVSFDQRHLDYLHFPILFQPREIHSRRHTRSVELHLVEYSRLRFAVKCRDFLAKDVQDL